MSPAVTKFARTVLSAAVRAALAGYRVAIGYARVRPKAVVRFCFRTPDYGSA